MRRMLKQLDQNCERWLLLVFYTMIVMTIGTDKVNQLRHARFFKDMNVGAIRMWQSLGSAAVDRRLRWPRFVH